MDKFILKDDKGKPVFIQQEENLTKPVVRLTPECYQLVKVLASSANISMGCVIGQCVTYAVANMAASLEQEDSNEY